MVSCNFSLRQTMDYEDMGIPLDRRISRERDGEKIRWSGNTVRVRWRLRAEGVAQDAEVWRLRRRCPVVCGFVVTGEGTKEHRQGSPSPEPSLPPVASFSEEMIRLSIASDLFDKKFHHRINCSGWLMGTRFPRDEIIAEDHLPTYIRSAPACLREW